MAWYSRQQYEEIKELGRGGFGQAKLVRKLIGTGQLYVVKEVNLAKVAESCGDDPVFTNKVILMTKMEAQNMLGLQHDNIVRVFGFFEESYLQCPYYHIVMEYCELGDLGKAIREATKQRAPFEEKQIRRWSRQLVSALKFLHENEFVHRDIKPANIFLVAKRQSVKLGDFGLGKQVDEIAVGKGNITAIGTEAYSSPEVCNSKPYTKKSDIWALGVVIHELASFKRPFEHRDGKHIYLEILNAKAPPIPEQYSKVVQQFIDMLLTKNPDERPTIEEVAQHRAIAHKSKDDNSNSTAAGSDPDQVPPLTPLTPNAPMSPDKSREVAVARSNSKSADNDTTKVRPVSAPEQKQSPVSPLPSNSSTPPLIGKSSLPSNHSSKESSSNRKASPSKSTSSAADFSQKDNKTIPNGTSLKLASPAKLAVHETPAPTSDVKALPQSKPPRVPAIEPVQLATTSASKPTANTPTSISTSITKPTPMSSSSQQTRTPSVKSDPAERKTSGTSQQSSAMPAMPQSITSSINLSGSADETLMLRQTRFAITSSYERDRTKTPTAPLNFTMTKVSKPPVVSQNPISKIKNKMMPIDEDLKEYGERTIIFKNVDRHAFAVSKTQHRSFKDLIWDLIYSQNITDDFEKARVLFLWLCTKDLGNMTFVNPQPDSPEEVLTHLKNGRRNYAEIFELMCSYSGLQCTLINGYAKGVSYKPGLKFVDNSFGHVWCALQIDNKWRFVDANWGSRAMVQMNSKLEYKLDEFYFLPPPEHLIYTHFPIDPKWQLLEKPITLAEFENLPHLSSLFFKLGLELTPNSKKLTQSPNTNGQVVIEIFQASKKANPAALDFIFTLKKENGKEEEYDVNGRKVHFNSFVFHDVDYSARRAQFSMKVPDSTPYHFSIYGVPLETVGTVISSGAVFNNIGEWIIHDLSIKKGMSSNSGNVTKLFPSCSSRRWGGPIASEAIARGLAKFPTESRISANKNGIIEIVFEKSSPKAVVNFTSLLMSGDPSFISNSEISRQYVLFRYVDEIKSVFTVSLPFPGEFGLEIFSSAADSKGGDNESLPHLCQYLLVWKDDGGKSKSTDKIRFPSLGGAYLGPKKQFEMLGMKCHSHRDPYIVIADWALPLDIEYSCAKSLQTSVNLIYQAPSSATEDYSEWVLRQDIPAHKRICFKCRFPKPGMYKLELFAKAAHDNDKSGSIPIAYCHLINVGGEVTSKPKKQNSNEVLPFPKQYSEWRNAYLAEPLDGTLKRHGSAAAGGGEKELKQVSFRLTVKDAAKVAVVVDDVWTQLVRQKDDSWQGLVSLQNTWENFGKAANNEKILSVISNSDGSTSYSRLLDYKLAKH